MSAFFFVFILIALAAAGGGCDFADPLPTATLNALIQRIQNEHHSDDKLKVLKAWAKNNTLGFTSNQTVTLLQEFAFSDGRKQVIATISDFILTLKAVGMIDIINSINFSSEKMDTLKVLVSLASEVELKLNKDKIVEECFVFASDKEEARKVIEAAKARSCLFGPANIPLFAFIIDVSGSMSEKFKDDDGTIYTRLGYVQRDLLKVMNSTLQPSQKFNIISFASSARAWQPGVVPVNATSIASAGNFVRALVPNGGTYMLTAFKLAFSDPNVLGIYFLSDGDPQDDKGSILRFVQATGKPVHTCAFKSTSTGAQFMYQIANTTKASFRNIV